MESDVIKVDWIDALEGGFGAATVLVTFGVVIGKTTPMQLLGICLIEIPLYLVNGYINYNLLGCVDAGGAIMIHTFGAYFGVMVSLVDRKRNYNHPSVDRSNSVRNLP